MSERSGSRDSRLFFFRGPRPDRRRCQDGAAAGVPGDWVRFLRIVARVDPKAIASCSDSERQFRDPLADAKIGGALARVVSGQRPARDPARGPGRARQARPSAARAARRRDSRRSSTSMRIPRSLRKTLDRAVHRAREPLVAHRDPDLAVAVRPDAGVPRCATARSRARSRRTRRATVAGAAAGADRAADRRTSASTRRSGSSATSSGYRRNGPSCTRCSRSRARGRSSGSRCRCIPDGGTTTIEHEYLIVLVLQLINSGQPDGAAPRVGAEQLDEWCEPLRLSLEPSSVTTFYVDLGSRTGLAPPHCRRRSKAACCSSTPAPLHALLMQNVVVLEQKIKSQPLSRQTRAAQRAARPADQARLAGRPRIQAVRAPRRAHVGARAASTRSSGFAKISGFLREEERASDARSSSIGEELRRHDGARRVRPHAQRARTAA